MQDGEEARVYAWAVLFHSSFKGNLRTSTKRCGISAPRFFCMIAYGVLVAEKHNNAMEKKFIAYKYIENGPWDGININNLEENDIRAISVGYKETPIPHNYLFVFREKGFIYVIPMHIGADPSCFVEEISDALYYDEIEYIDRKFK